MEYSQQPDFTRYLLKIQQISPIIVFGSTAQKLSWEKGYGAILKRLVLLKHQVKVTYSLDNFNWFAEENYLLFRTIILESIQYRIANIRKFELLGF